MQVVALRVVVGFPPAFVTEKIGGMRLVPVGELRSEHAPVTFEGIVPEAFFHQHLEGVAFAQVRDEVDLRGEDVRERDGEGHVFPLFRNGFRKRGLDGPFDHRQ